MSSPPETPYKSRLFNFLNRQYLRTNTRVTATVRHAKVAAIWGVQILLYPIYLLVQTGRVAGYILKHTVESSQLPEGKPKTHGVKTPPTTDTPIKKVLQTVEPLLTTSVELQPQKMNLPTELQEVAVSAKESRPQVVAVATLLETRNLVLVTKENQIIDFLSAEQQHELERRIRWEIAELWRYRRLIREAKKFPGRLPKSKVSNFYVLPPVRMFWQAMRWVQTSAVASAIDIFSESTLVRNVAPTSDYIELDNSSKTPQLRSRLVLSRLDETVASWESQPLQSTKTLVSKTGEFFGDVYHDLRIFWGGSANNTTKYDRNSRSEPLPLEDLLRAAIDYFFGRNHGQSLSSNNSQPALLPREEVDKLQLPGAETEKPKSISGVFHLRLAPVSKLAHAVSDRLTIAGQFRITIWANKSDRLQSTNPPNAELREPDPFRIEMLLRAAVDYFFGKNSSSSLPTNNHSPIAISGKERENNLSPSLSAAETEDPWLVWQDLFSEIESESTPSTLTSPSHTTELPASQGSQETFSSSSSSIFDRLKQRLNQESNSEPTQPTISTQKAKTQAKVEKIKQITEPQLPEIEDELSAAETRNTYALTPNIATSVYPRARKGREAISHVDEEDKYLENQQDWVETEATHVGYVKHPLEKVLEALDSFMLWLEELVVDIWRSLRDLFSR
ncbi:hypothetical protein [Oscillatoria salina]|uniref:hypothetical protein n=1 Tax=Oscillatoria salina TaxID=331517 RepID=UPI0013B7D825|nr:hypothetical protein [Oscillatoria salina]MBZ8182821.1 hypothetical protein [Oscillatoria salina IIICB1]NET90447.1 hypothetical protein [Kamptonema sp. SIO1D9]